MLYGRMTIKMSEGNEIVIISISWFYVYPGKDEIHSAVKGIQSTHGQFISKTDPKLGRGHQNTISSDHAPM